MSQLANRCDWGHRNCAGHFIQPAPGEVIRLGENLTHVSSELDWFLMGYVRGDGNLTEVRDAQGEAFVVKYLRDYHDPERSTRDGLLSGTVFEWEAVHIG